jgi:hypothetical protein
MSTSLPILTTSRQSAARRCQREHHYSYGLGYRPAVDAEPLRFGGLMHLGLDAWWKAVGGQQTLAGDTTPLDFAIGAMQGEADPFDRVRAEALMVGYDARWTDAAELYEVLAVEERFEAPLVNPETGAPSRTWILGGKIDAIVREKSTGRVLVVEHKTASSDITPGSDYWKRLRIDGQISTYFAGAAALGHDPQACIYDVIAKPAQRPSQIPVLDEDGVKIVLDAAGARVRTKDGKKWRESASSAEGYILQTRQETPEEYRARLLEAIASDPTGYSQRGEVVRLEAELAEAAFDAWQVAKQLREAELAGRFPRNPDACVRYGSTCPFFDVCTGTASLEDPERFRRSEVVNPELADQASAA